MTAPIRKVIARLSAIGLKDSGTAKHRPWLQEKTAQQNGDECDATEDPSDFCDFGYDVINNVDGRANDTATETKQSNKVS